MSGGGDQLSFPAFRINIQKQSDPVGKIVECAVFLRNTHLVKEKKTWQKFSKRFFEVYRPTILEYFGYRPDVLEVKKVKVNDSRLFMAVMTALLKTGRFDCQAKELAVAIDSVFDPDLKYSSILQGLYDNLLEYESVLSFFTDYKKNDFK